LAAAAAAAAGSAATVVVAAAAAAGVNRAGSPKLQDARRADRPGGCGGRPSGLLLGHPRAGSTSSFPEVTVKFRLPLIVLAIGLAAAGCSKKPAEAPKAAGTPAPGQAAPAAPGQPAAPKPVPAQLPDVLARVNGAAINRADFDRALAQLQAQAGGPVPPERRDAIYRQVLDQLIGFKLLSQEAQARKLNVPDAEIEGKLGDIKKQFPNEQAFTAALAERQMTPEGLKNDIRQQMLTMKLIETEVKPTVNVGEKEIADFYQKNPERFQQPEAVHAAHILIRVPENADEATKKKARADIDKAMAELKKKGADFAAIAKKYSQDGSAVNGGDLGFVAKGQTVPQFEAAAFALQPGQISAVVETPFGFHIIKAMERRPGRSVPLAEVKAQVGEFLTQEQMQQKTNAFVETLKAKGKVEILI
jgi:peptidyl-prolyl cis-trans isomerase C